MSDSIPNLFVIGASKCGTTFFHDLLSQHPDIFMSEVKELLHFNELNHDENTERYLENFRAGQGYAYRGESSPAYAEVTAFPHVPRAIHSLSPEAKIILIVRDPFSRFKSVWAQTLSTGHWSKEKIYKRKMPLSYRSAVISYPPFLDACRYFSAIRAYQNHFDDSQICVLFFEDLIKGFHKTLDVTFDFLSLERKQEIVSNPEKKNSRSQKRPYVPVMEGLAEIVPPSVRSLLPQELRTSAKNMLHEMTAPEFDHSDLSDADREAIRLLLEPEIEGLYKYTGRTDDPFGFYSPAAVPSDQMMQQTATMT